MIETWIDAMCAVWAGITTPLGTVKAPYLIKRAEFPSSINPSDDFPLALTIPADLEPVYSVGGPNEGFYTGVTEFHITPDLNKGHLPSLIPWFGKIWAAAAANMKLGGTCFDFRVTRIQGPIELQYGNEASHWGFIVNWEVKDTSNSSVSPGDSSVTWT